MVYLKGLAAGIIAVVVAIVLSPFVMGIYVYIVYHRTGQQLIGWDAVSFAKRPLAWLMIATIFAAGFFWEFRRAAK
jgi:hypothetical protein